METNKHISIDDAFDYRQYLQATRDKLLSEAYEQDDDYLPDDDVCDVVELFREYMD